MDKAETSLEEALYSAEDWGRPQSRDFKALGDIHVYAEVLQVASVEPFVTEEKLLSPEEGLRNRFRKLLLIQGPTKTNVRAVLSLLQRFGWLNADDKSRFTITPDGRLVALLSPHAFRRLVAQNLHRTYTIPGWFVSRLYDLNRAGQGEIILPAPPKQLGLGRREWAKGDWAAELDAVVKAAGNHANQVLSGAFPVEIGSWLSKVREVWERLAAGSPPIKKGSGGVSVRSRGSTTYGVRERLFHAMREAAIELLFGIRRPNDRGEDFPPGPHPIPYRAFTVWCPRLSELEFIFYTDYHPRITGRLIVPCGAFRYAPGTPDFEEISGVRDRTGRTLFLFQPSWDRMKSRFLAALLAVYRDESRRVGAFYVSLLAVRDEVCRQLRLSNLLFDSLLERAYEEAIRETAVIGRQFSISLESDIRPEQQSAVGLNQRPVYIYRVPHSLIAIGTNRSARV